MKDLGYHAGYRYAHEDPVHCVPQEYLPDELRGTRFYEPGPFAYEREIAKRLAWWTKRKEQGGTSGNDGTEDGPDR